MERDAFEAMIAAALDAVCDEAVPKKKGRKKSGPLVIAYVKYGAAEKALGQAVRTMATRNTGRAIPMTDPSMVPMCF